MPREATMPESSPEAFELASFLPFRFSNIGNRLNRGVTRFCTERFKLSAPEWRTMAVLARCGATSVRSMVAETAMDKVRVSRAVTDLLKAGYIARDADLDDRRRAFLMLTPEGLNIYRQIVPLVQEIEAKICALLSPEEQTTLNSVLAKIEVHLEKSNLEISEPDT